MFLFFPLGLSSSFVELLCSKMTDTQSKNRSSLDSDIVLNVFHVHDTVMQDPAKPILSKVSLKAPVTGSVLQQKQM